MVVDVIIPALNEEGSIAGVVHAIADPRVRRVIVANNGSTDATGERAREAGAVVVFEPKRGYGRACLTALAYAGADPPDAVAFVDGDLADDPADLSRLLDALTSADLVIGSRATGVAEPGALTAPQRFGNWLATRLIDVLYDVRFTDLGPFRAVRWSALERIAMRDENFGWTVEMQLRAAKLRLRCAEVPVRYRRRRTGQSKVSGTIRGSVMAGTIILSTIAKEAARDDIAWTRLRSRAHDR